MIYLLCRLLPTDTTNKFFKIKKSEAITVEPKEGIEEGGHTARWVIAEVVCVTGCSRSRPYPSPWSHRRHRIGGAPSRAEHRTGVWHRATEVEHRAAGWSAAPLGGGHAAIGWRAAEWSSVGWMEQECLSASVSILGVLVIG
jgi:hypothetical protein